MSPVLYGLRLSPGFVLEYVKNLKLLLGDDCVIHT